jgi:hypothetical protein
MHEEEGDLQRALYEYRLAKTVSRSDRAVLKHVQRVEKKITQRTSDLMKKAERAGTRGEQKSARALYLEVLGLQPDHPQAVAALRQQDKRRALRRATRRQEAAKKQRQKRRNSQQRDAYAEEGFTYSRQAILDAASQLNHGGQLIKELERHLEKYPKDDGLCQQLIETSLAQAKKAYQARQLDAALNYLNRAELVCRKGQGQRWAVGEVRKQYARELYRQGVISYRSEPQRALNYWNYAVKFDPEDEKSRLRIRSMSKRP